MSTLTPKVDTLEAKHTNTHTQTPTDETDKNRENNIVDIEIKTNKNRNCLYSNEKKSCDGRQFYCCYLLWKYEVNTQTQLEKIEE